MIRLVASVLAVTALVTAAPAAEAAFPGKNGKIAFTSYTSTCCASEIFLVSDDGTGLQQLTDKDVASAYGAVFSPDGSQILFDGKEGLTIVTPDGVVVRRLGHFGSPGGWSPDAQTVVYSGGVQADIFTVDVAGGPARQLIFSSSEEDASDWSPTGERIAISSNFGLVNFRSIVYSMKADGSEDLGVPLTNGLSSDRNADWSPDGSKIVFDSNRNFEREIYVMNSDGSNETRLTTNLNGAHDPEWSPDGKRIAFVRRSNDDLDSEVYVMNADGSGERRVTFNDTDDITTDWQPVPNRPPDCSGVAASPGSLWPPNRRLVNVSLTGSSDPDGDPVSLEITGVTQDEPVGAQPDARAGDTADTVRLRAERAVRGDGRIYRIAFEGTDDDGGACEGTATVAVPRRPTVTAVDSAPPSFDSFGG